MKVTITGKEIIVEGAPAKILVKAEEVIHILMTTEADDFNEENGCFISELDAMIIDLFSTKYHNFPKDFLGWVPCRVSEAVLYYEPECAACTFDQETQIYEIDINTAQRERMKVIHDTLIDLERQKAALVNEHGYLFYEMVETDDGIPRDLLLERISVLAHGFPMQHITNENASPIQDYFECISDDDDELMELLHELEMIYSANEDDEMQQEIELDGSGECKQQIIKHFEETSDDRNHMEGVYKNLAAMAVERDHCVIFTANQKKKGK